MTLYNPVKIGSLKLPGNLFLAPVAGYTDRAFRSLCVEEGANFSFTELVSAESLYRKPENYGLGNPDGDPMSKIKPLAANLIKRGEKEKHYAIQLFGSVPESIYKAAILLAPLAPDVPDINAGCPVHKITKNGAGSALMRDPSNLGKIVEEANRASREYLGNIPVTIKIRSGWDSKSLNYAECARIAVEAGAAMISLHPRTRSQNYSGISDWSHIKDLVSRLSVPVAGSGDLYTPEDAQRMLTETGCSAVMFARGAMGNPFIFRTTRSLLTRGKWEPVPLPERLNTALSHLKLLAVDIGEHTACLEMRKQFCAYSKGFVGGASLRNALVHAETIADFCRIINTATGR